MAERRSETSLWAVVGWENIHHFLMVTRRKSGRWLGKGFVEHRLCDPEYWVPWMSAASWPVGTLNLSREARWLCWTRHMPPPWAPQLAGYYSVLSLLQTPSIKKGRTSESDTLELTYLLTIMILSFKPEISQIGEIKLFTAELYSVLYNWFYYCEIKVHYVHA